MQADELRHIGQQLFGARWRQPLANRLGVTRETVSRWSHGKQAISSTAAKAIRLLKDDKAKAPYPARRFRAKGESVVMGGATLIHGDSRKIILPQPVDVIFTDPVWPEASISLVGSDDPVGLLCEALQHLTQYLKPTGRIIIQLGCDSDPRILEAVPQSLFLFAYRLATVCRTESQGAHFVFGRCSVYFWQTALGQNQWAGIARTIA